ncbi:MAG: LacI family DNA-binding transcriptional regulator [Planctomycetota bacterium]
MASTIYEIASRAGVSKSTVARVLRGELKESSPRIAERADRIRQLARELNYRPNWRARAFSNQKTNGIGLLYAQSHVVFRGVMSEVAEAFDVALRKKGYHLVMVPCGDGNESWRNLVLGGAVDGIAMLFEAPRASLEAIAESGLPAVLMGDRLDKSAAEIDAPEVTMNDYQGSYTATKHLTDLGHRDIVMLFYEYERDHYSVAERRAGFDDALSDAGIDSDARFLTHMKAEYAEPILSRPSLPSAVVCYSHFEALAVTQGLWAHDLRVPEDVSVVGFNDLVATRFLTPPLTTVAFDTRAIGRIGAELLVKQIEGDDPAAMADVVMPEQLVVRSSTGPPRQTEPVWSRRSRRPKPYPEPDGE